MQQRPMSLIEFQRKFATEKACQYHLFQLRWPEGYQCPRCGYTQASFHTTRSLYQCKACKYQVSLTAGTIFHKTRTPLRKWFWMIFLMGRQKSGISMLSLKRMLEITSYRTVWMMGHKIRKAMATRDAYYKLAGLLSVVFGVLIAVWPGVGLLTLVWLVAIYAILFGVLNCGNRIHQPVVVGTGKNAVKVLPWVHTVIANVKGNIRGVYHGVSPKHLSRYLSEFCYRFNRRFWEPQMFDRILTACVDSTTITYAELKA